MYGIVLNSLGISFFTSLRNFDLDLDPINDIYAFELSLLNETYESDSESNIGTEFYLICTI